MSAKLKYSHVKHIGYKKRGDGQEIAVTLTFTSDGNVTQNEIIDHITERLKDEPKAEPIEAKDFYCISAHYSNNKLTCDVQCIACNLSSK